MLLCVCTLQTIVLLKPLPQGCLAKTGTLGCTPLLTTALFHVRVNKNQKVRGIKTNYATQGYLQQIVDR